MAPGGARGLREVIAIGLALHGLSLWSGSPRRLAACCEKAVRLALPCGPRSFGCAGRRAVMPPPVAGGPSHMHRN
eukprot:10496248-Alexandrium_andersonii.AAC.1